jgi:hypothetical protein
MSEMDTVPVVPTDAELSLEGVPRASEAVPDGASTQDKVCNASNVQEAGDDGSESEEGSDAVQETLRWFLVEGKGGVKVDRVCSAEFVENNGLQKIVEAFELAAQDEEDIAALKSRRWKRCDCQFPHDMIACSMLHSKDESLRIGRTDYVRIQGALPNSGLENLLRNPKGRHAWCTTKKEHDPTTCRFLHRDPSAICVGRERLGYLPEELVDNSAARHLMQNPEHVGRWCTNVLKHEPKTCTFVHKAPRMGQSLGKRNQNVSKDGRLAVKSSAAFERKKRSGRVVAAAGTEIPEFARKQDALDALVSRINADDEIEDEASQIDNASAEATTVGHDPASLDEAAPQFRTKGIFGFLSSLHPAMLAMLAAVLLALLVQLIPSG